MYLFNQHGKIRPQGTASHFVKKMMYKHKLMSFSTAFVRAQR